jgi:hypothetical protein
VLSIRKVDENFGIWNGYNSEFLRWQDIYISEDEVKTYIIDNPFPKDDFYNVEYFIGDLEAEGSIIIPSTNRELAKYILELINNFI